MNAAAENMNEFESNVSQFEATLSQHIADEETEEQEEEIQEAAENEVDIYALEPTEFIDMYKKLSVEEKNHIFNGYKKVLEIRDRMNGEMEELKSWCEVRNIHFATYKAVYKRATDPKKKQNQIDATFVFFGKELGGGMQKELFD